MAEVYVDTNAMSEWQSKMESINNNCISSIEEIESSIRSLNSSLQGSYADSYEESFSSFTKTVKQSHEAMSDFSGFLDSIVNVMNKQ